ncbi:glycosyltransferase family 2 protein [Sulfolobus tengchongensis]|uniref:Glycosyltransferase family 2 protein n=1 Tax=Sulfolobus tengchongensis TaxID=207809 RepID=A0AAX4KZH9_9CREN
MSNICIYGTVYNNYNTIEYSIKSIWRPDYVIVITDNYSTDGTWEKLQEIKKEYNLILYRLRSSRGKGRDYSLRHCPDNSKTSFFDLDVEYNENFHRITEWSSLDKITYAHWLFIGKKEYIVNKGGWRDLNGAEDVELINRIGFDYYIPVIVGKSIYKGKATKERESRYAHGTKLLLRNINNFIDTIRGCGFNWREVYNLYFKYRRIHYSYLPIILGIYFIAKLKRIYRYSSLHDNITNSFLERLNKLTLPKELNIPDDYFLFGISRRDLLLYSDLERLADIKLKEKIGDYKKFLCSDSLIRYVKNSEGLKKALELSNLSKIECHELN